MQVLSGDWEEAATEFSIYFPAFPDDTAKLIICVAYNAIRLADVQRNQLASSAKAMGIKNAPKEKNGLVKVVAEALVKKELCQNQREPKKCFKAWHTKAEAILIAFKCGLIPSNYNTKFKKFVVFHFVQPGHL